MKLYIYIYIIFYNNCVDTDWTQSPKMKRTKAQRVQNNEFVESGLKTEPQWIEQ